MSAPKEKSPRPSWWPSWFTGSSINETEFCQEFLEDWPLEYTENAFFTNQGRMKDESLLQQAILVRLQRLIGSNITRRINSIIELMKIITKTDKLLPQPDRVHVANGTLFLDGRFDPGMDKIVRSRFPVPYTPDAPQPTHWLRFLSELLYPEDIPTLQEFIGYCLIPSNKGQRMMVIKGRGGEGKSQVGAVLSKLFGCNMKDGSVGKISENRFARADLEHIHLMVDDDMQMEALKQTNYVKSLVTAQGMMDLERKGKQSYQGWLYARILAFSNGDLQSLYDRSDGFYRRQLILTTKDRPADRVDDPDLADRMTAELPGIFNWAFEGLQRLAANDFHFTESERCKANRQAVKRDANNVFAFMEAEDYVMYDPKLSASSRDLYNAYCKWCDANAYDAFKQRSFSDIILANMGKYNIVYSNNLTATDGKRVRGFTGIAVKSRGFPSAAAWQEASPEEVAEQENLWSAVS